MSQIKEKKLLLSKQQSQWVVQNLHIVLKLNLFCGASGTLKRSQKPA
jgi:hypothetical protein